MSTVQKFLLSAFGVALVVLIITISSNAVKRGKEDNDQNISQYNETIKGRGEIELCSYDGIVVDGKNIKRLIKDFKDNSKLSIVVDTGRGTATSYINTCSVSGVTVDTDEGFDYSEVSYTKTDTTYISDLGLFAGTVYYDDNSNVACIWFTQQ